MKVIAGWKRFAEHVRGDHVDAAGVAAIGEQHSRGLVDRWALEHGGADVRVAVDQRARVDPGAAADVERAFRGNVG